MTKLRAVTDEDAEQVDPLEAGDKRAELVELRSIVRGALRSPKTHPRDISPLTRRLQEISDEIRSMDASEETDDIGQAAATPDEKWSAG
jgi:hypothetical protein